MQALNRTPRRPLAPLLLTLLAACGGENDPPGAVTDDGGAELAADADAGEAAAPSPSPQGPAAPVGPESGSAEGDYAELVCTAPAHNFGRVWSGSQVSHEFEFSVGGDLDLVITDFRSDCGCTVAHLEVEGAAGGRRPYELQTPLAPGTKLRLGATFDTTNREGLQAKTVRIFANVPGGVYQLKFSANIKKLLEIQPRTGVIERMTVLEEREVEFMISGNAGEPYALEPLREGLPDTVTVRAEPIEPEADGRASSWRVIATLSPGMPTGNRNYTLQLRTDITTDVSPRDEAGNPIPFVAQPRVSAVIEGLVSVQPQNLNFGMVRSAEVVAKTVTLSTNDPDFELPEPTWEVKPYKEGASTAFAETLRVTPRRAENGRDWELELLLEGLNEEVPRSFLGRLILNTGHPTEPTLEIVLSGLRRGG